MMTIRRLLFAFVLIFFSFYVRASESDPRVKVFIYSENKIFRIDTSYGYQSFIQFSDKEKIKTVALGNSIGWSINPVDEKIFLRPLEKSLSTNMIVVTDRRTYVFDLFSGVEESTQDSYGTHYIVRFRYLDEISSESDDIASTGGISINGKLHEFEYDDLCRNYSFTGKADFILTEVMSNPDLTFFKFEGVNIPRIFVVNPDRTERQAKMWRFKEYMVIEGVYKKLHLRYQDSMLEVVNNDLD